MDMGVFLVFMGLLEVIYKLSRLFISDNNRGWVLVNWQIDIEGDDNILFVLYHIYFDNWDILIRQWCVWSYWYEIYFYNDF